MMQPTTTSHSLRDGAAALRIRPAHRDDAVAVARIYNEGIRARIATFETAEREPASVIAWLESPDAERWPFLVAEAGDPSDPAVLGWIRASAYRPRDCYAGVAEFSIYVAEAARGQRVGDALMAEFLPACEAAGFWKVLSRVFPENLPSRALCARHGFREVGTYSRHARLGGVWRDVVIVERLLGE